MPSSYLVASNKCAYSMDDIFEKVSAIYQFYTPKDPRKFGEPDENTSVLNPIGVYRLKDKFDQTLFRIKASDIENEYQKVSEISSKLKAQKVKREKAKAESEAADQELADAFMTLGKGNLEVIGGFWKHNATLKDGYLYLFRRGSGISEKLPASDFNLEQVTEENKKVIGRVFKGAIWGIGLGLVSVGLGLLGGAAGLLTGRQTQLVFMATHKKDPNKILLLKVKFDLFQEFKVASMIPKA